MSKPFRSHRWLISGTSGRRDAVRCRVVAAGGGGCAIGGTRSPGSCAALVVRGGRGSGSLGRALARLRPVRGWPPAIARRHRDHRGHVRTGRRRFRGRPLRSCRRADGARRHRQQRPHDPGGHGRLRRARDRAGPIRPPAVPLPHSERAHRRRAPLPPRGALRPQDREREARGRRPALRGRCGEPGARYVLESAAEIGRSAGRPGSGRRRRPQRPARPTRRLSLRGVADDAPVQRRCRTGWC